VSYRTNELEWEGGAGFSKDKDNVEALILFGYSAGGNLACHVVKALENRGRTVSDILMIDSSRKMNLYVFAPKEIKTVTQQFLNHETIAPYVENVLLRDKVAQKPLGIINMLEIPQTIFS
jgi:surfactin synthase thioesterase subunit